VIFLLFKVLCYWMALLGMASAKGVQST
jgi:hypothetical protein